MASASAERPRNNLLSRMSAADFALLQPHLTGVDCALRMHIEEPNKPIKHVYFPESGIVSVVAVAPGGKSIEAGLIGCEGMPGLAVVMGSDRSPNAAYVQVAARAQRLGAGQLRDAMRQSETLRALLLRFAQAFLAQTVHTALANGRAKIEERLARRLLMAHDRTDGDEISLTHEFMAIMLGVRRAGVTTALHLLEGGGLIAARRGVVVVRNRSGLEELANGHYGVPEAEYRRLIGWRSPHAQ